jgi:cytochrome c-type biogenesis protein CcmH
VLQSASKAAPAADIREPSSDLEPTAPSIEVSVSLSDEFTQNFAPTDVVFIFARAVNGPPMPLAASKHRISELPLTVVLNDSTAMSPQFTLSSVDEVNVVARVSKSGQPIAQAGDVQSVPVRVSTRELSSVALVMDQAVR